MAIDVTCPCSMRFRAKDELAGVRVKCPGCGKPVAVPVPPMAPIVVDEDGPLSDEIGEPSVFAKVRAKVTPLHRGLMDNLVDAFKPAPDHRPLDVRRHEEIVAELRKIRSRLGWIIFLIIVLSIGSCSAANVYFEQQSRSQTRLLR